MNQFRERKQVMCQQVAIHFSSCTMGPLRLGIDSTVSQYHRSSLHSSTRSNHQHHGTAAISYNTSIKYALTRVHSPHDLFSIFFRPVTVQRNLSPNSCSAILLFNKQRMIPPRSRTFPQNLTSTKRRNPGKIP